jgi:probable HAF family extracellular repeat protein
MHRLLASFAPNLCFALLVTQAVTAQRYKITDLGTLPGGSVSVGIDINRAGQVTGEAGVAGGDFHAFLYSHGTMQDLGTLPGGKTSTGSGINGGEKRGREWDWKRKEERVQVTGYADLPNGQTHAFLYSDGIMQDLGTLPGGSTSYGFGINGREKRDQEWDWKRKEETVQVTGASEVTGNKFHAFLYSHGTIQDLGTLPGGRQSYGYAINDSGQVTGFSDTNIDGDSHAFLYSDGTMQDLGTLPGGLYSFGYAINRSGQVAGGSEINPGPTPGFLFPRHAFLYSNGVMQDLGTLPDSHFSEAMGINQAGQVVGNAILNRSLDPRPFLYSDGKLQDLNSLISSDSGWLLLYAFAINDRGQITGTGIHNGMGRAFLLTPVCSSNGKRDRDDDECDEEEEQER